MGNLLYHLFVYSYAIGAKLIAPWNPKAKQWLKGRAILPSLKDNKQPCIWMHCASLGEFEQGRPLLEKLKAQYPTQKIVLTFFSPSGYEIMKDYKGVDFIFYLPMDTAANAQKFIEAINPSLVLWVKYEFWFNYLTLLKAKNIPVLMVSGLFRKNQPFFRWYGGIWRQMLHSFSHFFLQNEASVQLLQSLNITNNVSIAGDTRFDRVIEIAAAFEPMPLIASFCGNQRVIVAGSTWEDDENEWIHYVRKNPSIQFIFAPHEINTNHLEDLIKEFPGAILYSQLVQQQENAGVTLPDNSDKNSNAFSNVLIIDNVGMLSKIYHYANITYVGGGFDEGGIHNVLEPAVFGKPVIFGPVYQKFAEAVDLVNYGAGISISTALELEDVLNELWGDPAMLAAKSQAAKEYVYSKVGATAKVMAYIQVNRLLTN